jgi:site-specific DNA-methyltransferase (adenine-specific)
MDNILYGDSKIELKKVQDNSVDMLCTDPPYGYSFMNKGWDKVLPDVDIWKESYSTDPPYGYSFMNKGWDKVLPDVDIWKESYRVLKEGSFICVMAAPRSDVLWRLCRDLEGVGFDLSFSNIEWVYHTGFPKASDTKKMIEKRRLNGDKYEGSKLGFQPKPAREIIVVAMKPFKEKSYIDKVLNFEDLPENIQRTYPLIQTPKPSKKEKTIGTQKNIHPTVKPIKLMSYLITLFTREGDYVLDPFMGSGTTGLACKLLNREFIGIDFTEEYVEIAKERLEVTKEELIKTLKIKLQGELF